MSGQSCGGDEAWVAELGHERCQRGGGSGLVGGACFAEGVLVVRVVGVVCVASVVGGVLVGECRQRVGGDLEASVSVCRGVDQHSFEEDLVEELLEVVRGA